MFSSFLTKAQLSRLALGSCLLVLGASGCSTAGGGSGGGPMTVASGGPTGGTPTSTPPAPPTPDSSVAVITTPRDGSQVHQCALFAGTARLSPTKTLVLAVSNQDNGNATQYLEPVKNWQVPSQLTTWRGAQYFGSEDSSVGQTYAVELLIVDLATVEQADDIYKKSGGTWTTQTRIPGSRIAARVELKRVAGQGPIACR